MNSKIIQWAIRHQVSQQALIELREIFALDGAGVMPLGASGMGESAVQAVVRLEAARKGMRLWRNNVGALLDTRGVPVRYGLANDSKQVNEKVKSGDLIGWRPMLIDHSKVGSVIAQFVSRECKQPGWNYKGDEHEQAQLKWAELVVADGGDAQFCTGEGTL
jgi:hypothetical protein